MSKTVAVIFGGASNENEISVITGTMASNVLISGGDEVIPVYIAQNGVIYTGQCLSDISSFKHEGYKKCSRAIIANGGIYALNNKGKVKKFTKIDVVLNCCHGGAGEGGAVNGLCAFADLPLAGAGIFESSAFMDKYITKLVLSALKIKTVGYVYVKSLEELDRCPHMPDFPLIVKPVGLGSSIGVEKAENGEELKKAVEVALTYDSAVIIEKYITNRREINCAAYYSGGKVVTSECEESVGGGAVFTFEDKYGGGGMSVIPANITKDISASIRNLTAEVYSRLNMRGIVRFDFILSGEDIYLSEINTVPGSLSYYLLSTGFKNFYPVLSEVITQAQKDFQERKGKKLIMTGILENIPQNGGKLKNK